MSQSYILPTTASRDALWRKWTCKACGFSVEGTTSLYRMNKWWNDRHHDWHTYSIVQGYLSDPCATL